MLPKRSTPVDQTLVSKSIHSQLSVAIFTASRTYVVAQKSSKQLQTPLKLLNPYQPTFEFISLRDISGRNVPVQVLTCSCYEQNGIRYLTMSLF